MASLYRRNAAGIQRADPFIDLLFNALLGFTFLFMASLLFINPPLQKAKVDMQAEYIISATWDENLADDIDLWVQSPDGERVSYLQREAGWLHLDRDDRGEINDVIFVDGEEKIHRLNQEIVTIRGRQSGEYIVNLYYYQNASPPPLQVKIRVDKVNPSLKTVYAGEVELGRRDQELTAVRFSIRDDGSVHGISQLPAILTPYQLDHIPAWAK